LYLLLTTTRIVLLTKATNAFALPTYGQYVCSYWWFSVYAEESYRMNYARINTQ